MRAEQRPEEEPGNEDVYSMRVIVDETLCEIGHSDVVHVAEGEVPEHLEIDVRAAVDQCPKAALRIAD